MSRRRCETWGFSRTTDSVRLTRECDRNHSLAHFPSIASVEHVPCAGRTGSRKGKHMALTDSKSGKILRHYSTQELKDSANLMRAYDLVALHAAGSGHAGGTLSIMDITAALYLEIANHDPRNPNWADRDRIIWSTGHKAPSLYLGLAFAGFCPIDCWIERTPIKRKSIGSWRRKCPSSLAITGGIRASR